jgi:hypothetical protein
MGRILDLTGKKFGMLTVVQFDSKDRFGRAKWRCQCDCGNISTVQSGNLKTGISKSCGCLINKPSPRRRDYDGHVFGKLTVVYSERINSKTYCFCKCSCGNEVTIWAGHLPSGHTNSCGCLKNEHCSKMGKDQIGKYGPLSKRYNHNLSEEDRQRRRSAADKEWAKKVLKANKYICLKCNAKGGEMHSHHLTGYSGNKEKRTMISNGVALCKKCHIKYHSLFGVKNIKKSDFHKWIDAPEYDILDSELQFHIPTKGRLGNTAKYISRAGKKDSEVQDLKKARWYLDREIERLEREQK